jgi:hypothetical protein
MNKWLSQLSKALEILNDLNDLSVLLILLITKRTCVSMGGKQKFTAEKKDSAIKNY